MNVYIEHPASYEWLHAYIEACGKSVAAPLGPVESTRRRHLTTKHAPRSRCAYPARSAQVLGT